MHTVLMQIGCVKTTSPLCATPRLSLKIPSRCSLKLHHCPTATTQAANHSQHSKHCMTEPTSSSRLHNTVSTTSCQGTSAHASTESPLAQSHFRFQPLLHGAFGSLSRLPPCIGRRAIPCTRTSDAPPFHPSPHTTDTYCHKRQHVPYCVVCVHASRVNHTICMYTVPFFKMSLHHRFTIDIASAPLSTPQCHASPSRRSKTSSSIFETISCLVSRSQLMSMSFSLHGVLRSAYPVKTS